jgi:SAM-dependent methyltransferase
MDKENGFYFTRESVREYIEMSEGFDGREIIKKLEKHLAAGSSILELGTGPGRDLAILKRKYEVTGSDISPLFIDYCENEARGVEVLLLDAVSIDIHLKFDAIYSNKVLQHLSDRELADSVRRQAEVLNMGGIVCHTFWEGDGEEYIEDMRFNYQKTGDLKRLFSAYFELLDTSIYKEIRDKDSVLLIARKTSRK